MDASTWIACILCAIPTGTLALFFGWRGWVAFVDKTKWKGAGCISLLIAGLSGLVAFFSGLAGLILFVKWVWA